MTPYKQRNQHDPDNGVFGDCFRTCLACLLDLTPGEVPHFHDQNPGADVAWAKMEKWLAGRGLAMIRVAYATADIEVILKLQANLNPGIFYLLGGRTPGGVEHIVIAKDGAIHHDPALGEGGITQPTEDGYYDLMYLVPAFMKAKAGQIVRCA